MKLVSKLRLKPISRVYNWFPFLEFEFVEKKEISWVKLVYFVGGNGEYKV